MKRRLPFQAAVVLAFCVFSVCAAALPARADTIATIDVNASFLTGPGVIGAVATFPPSGPAFYATGQFAVDVDTLAVSSWNITFLGPLGVTYDLSPQDGGVATAFCNFSAQCPNSGIWFFDFSNANASFAMDTLPVSAPFAPGQILQLCPTGTTIYPGTPPTRIDSPVCDATSGALFNGEPGVVYELADGLSTSGTLTVVSVASTPEPGESTLLLLGLAILIACAPFRRINLSFGRTGR